MGLLDPILINQTHQAAVSLTPIWWIINQMEASNLTVGTFFFLAFFFFNICF